MAGTDQVARLRALPWQEPGYAVPDVLYETPSMLWNAEKRMLYHLAREHFTGKGAIADMGAYLGSSTVCFAAGVHDQGITRPVVHSYDLFVLSTIGSELRQYPYEVPEDLRTRPVFERHLGEYLPLVAVHEGDVLEETWGDEPIEILFVDIAKSYKVLDHLLLNFFGALIPERSLVIMQDYLWQNTGPWHHVVMEKLAPYFEYVVDNGVASAVFQLTRELPREALESALYLSIPMDEKLALMDRAIERQDTEEKKDYLRANRELLVSGEDLRWGMHYHSL